MVSSNTYLTMDLSYLKWRVSDVESNTGFPMLLGEGLMKLLRLLTAPIWVPFVFGQNLVKATTKQ